MRKQFYQTTLGCPSDVWLPRMVISEGQTPDEANETIARRVVCVRVCTDSLIGGDVSFCQMTLDTLFSSEM